MSEFSVISVKAQQLVNNKPSFMDLIQALALVVIEDIREINSDMMDDDFVKDGLPSLDDLERMAVDHLLITYPDMYDYTDFRAMFTDAIKCAGASDPRLFELTYRPRRKQRERQGSDSSVEAAA